MQGKTRKILISLLFLLCLRSVAQLDSLLNARGIQMSTQKDSLRPFQKNFFHQFGGTVLFDFGAGNPTGRYDYVISNNGAVKDSLPQSNEYLTLGALTYEPRYNLFNFKDFFSVSFNLPTTAQFCIYTKKEGVFGLRTIPMIDINLFNHATFNNLSKFGINIGAGYALNASPLLYFDLRPGDTDKKFWTSYVVRGGMKFPFRGKNCFLNFIYGFPTETIVKHPYTYKKGWMAVVTVGILLNYD